MGVTGSIFKSLTFDGESSRDYGVYISGSGTYNAPERDVEMITIPYRNGAFVQDNGRFNNIEVTYPAGVYADNEADFAEAVSNFRNFLSSHVGYCRLEDEYNPDEYRLAVYKSGLEVSPKMLKAGEFNIVFECKPQRFLKSGEVPTKDPTNPTRFNASPLLLVEGYGRLSFNGASILLLDKTYGEVSVADYATDYDSVRATIDGGILNTGDTIQVGEAICTVIYTSTYTRITAADSNNSFKTTVRKLGTNTYEVKTSLVTPATFTYLTDGSVSDTVTLSLYSGTSLIETARNVVNLFQGARYGETESIISLGETVSQTEASFVMVSRSATLGKMKGLSTKRMLGDPTYIDCEICEAYKYEDDVLMPLNGCVYFSGTPPVFRPGINGIKRDQTLSLDTIIPRWWKI